MRTSSIAVNPLAAAIAAVVIDGDTVEQDGRRYRLLGYDTPETGGRLMGRLPQRRSGKNCAGALVSELRPTGRCCKWGRECAQLYVNGADVSWVMVRRGYAIPYRGGKRQSWCAWR